MCTPVRFIKRAACLLLAEVHTRSAMMADATSELEGPGVRATTLRPCVHLEHGSVRTEHRQLRSLSVGQDQRRVRRTGIDLRCIPLGNPNTVCNTNFDPSRF